MKTYPAIQYPAQVSYGGEDFDTVIAVIETGKDEGLIYISKFPGRKLRETCEARGFPGVGDGIYRRPMEKTTTIINTGSEMMPRVLIYFKGITPKDALKQTLEDLVDGKGPISITIGDGSECVYTMQSYLLKWSVRKHIFGAVTGLFKYIIRKILEAIIPRMKSEKWKERLHNLYERLSQKKPRNKESWKLIPGLVWLEVEYEGDDVDDLSGVRTAYIHMPGYNARATLRSKRSKVEINW